MRDFKGMKRQRGRNRGGGQGGGKPQHNANRAFESNGPEGVKVRGAAQGVYEKYQQLARDAASAGDRVLAENYLQHAEHYFRVLRAVQPHRPVSEIIGRDTLGSGYDIDFEAEPEEQDPSATIEQPESSESDGEGRQEHRDERPRDRDDRPRDRDDRPRDAQRDGQRFEGQRNDRNDRFRDDRPRDGQRDGQRDERPRDAQRDDRPREDRQRFDRDRNQGGGNQQGGQQGERQQQGGQNQGAQGDRPQGEGRRDRWRDRNDRNDRYDRGDRPERSDRDPLAVIEPQAAAPLAGPMSFAPEPKAKADKPARSPRLRAQDGDVSEAPAFLSRSSAPASTTPISSPASAPPPVAAAEEAPAKKPRAPRKPRVAAESEDA